MVMFIALSFHCNFFCLASFPQITSSCDYRLGTFITEHTADELHIHPAKIMAKPEAFQSQSDFSKVTKNAQRKRKREHGHLLSHSLVALNPIFCWMQVLNPRPEALASNDCWRIWHIGGSTMAAGITIEQSFQCKCWYLSSKLHSTSQEHCFISEISWNRSERETKDSTSFFTTITLMPVWSAICITGSFRGVNPHLITREILNGQWFVCS